MKISLRQEYCKYDNYNERVFLSKYKVDNLFTSRAGVVNDFSNNVVPPYFCVC